MGGPQKLYMIVTNDRFELPMSPAMDINEICAFLGRSKTSIWSEIKNSNRKDEPKYRYRCKKNKVISFMPGADWNADNDTI